MFDKKCKANELPLTEESPLITGKETPTYFTMFNPSRNSLNELTGEDSDKEKFERLVDGLNSIGL
ncbi:hypothetical protein [Legionella maioricensis]|uniref:Uncharacterized protein n=1 Tax=Legionella maioricensis TaxID=2896528 RepID=A0A9X2IA65_9GAMM|nr:hypothetical protein [Legionella maioricensis]MCL9683779.1 hypothetical protein [Legionella maioricensis]MCL9686626.1 hypothetical protein [Legionella maioricensis]